MTIIRAATKAATFLKKLPTGVWETNKRGASSVIGKTRLGLAPLKGRNPDCPGIFETVFWCVEARHAIGRPEGTQSLLRRYRYPGLNHPVKPWNFFGPEMRGQPPGTSQAKGRLDAYRRL
jgi:hypothetical protein